MNIYLLDDPGKPAVCAMFSHVGTWHPDDYICKQCGQYVGVGLIEPLLIEWDPGTENIGDFSWCGYHCIVKDHVRAFLQERGFECEFGRVEVVRPTGPKYKMPRVKFPYAGPNLHWVIPTTRLELNEEESGVTLVMDCAVCGVKSYNIKREGLVIDGLNWRDEKMFRIEQLRGSATFVTKQALDELLCAGFTNFCSRPAGVINEST